MVTTVAASWFTWRFHVRLTGGTRIVADSVAHTDLLDGTNMLPHFAGTIVSRVYAYHSPHPAFAACVPPSRQV